MTSGRRDAVKVDVQGAAGRNAPVRAVLRLEDLLREVRQGLPPAGPARRAASVAATQADATLPAALAALEKALRRQRALNRRGGR